MNGIMHPGPQTSATDQSNSPDANGVADQSSVLRRANWELRCQLAETRHALDLSRQELDRTINSRSWRATGLLRRSADAARRLFHLGDEVPGAGASQLRPLAEFGPAPPHGEAPLLLVDVTELAIANLQGGIQHTVKGILSEWLIEQPAGWQVEPVQLTAEGVYVSASKHLRHVYGDLDSTFSGCRVPSRSGDVFIGLDLLRDHAAVFRKGLQALKDDGVHVQVVVYDLLPVDMPECVPSRIASSFNEWLDVVGDLADGVSAISVTVAQRFSRWVSARGRRNAAVALGSFRLGVPSASTQGPAWRSRAPSNSPSFLMVGTLEPRKGYAQAIDAFDLLWQSGADVRLTIIGRYGWGMSELAQRIESHPEMGGRLKWIRQATDAEVQASYEQSDALLFSSHGEGFGLPIVEAAQYGLPLVLRDLPEFREVAGDGAFYFEGGGQEIAAALSSWMDLARAGRIPEPAPGVVIPWKLSAEQLLDGIAAAAGVVGRNRN